MVWSHQDSAHYSFLSEVGGLTCTPWPPHPALPPVKYQTTAAPAAPTAPSQEALSRAVCWPCLHTDPRSRSLRLAQTLEQCSRAGWWLLSRAGSHVTQPRSFLSRLSGSAPADTVLATRWYLLVAHTQVLIWVTESLIEAKFPPKCFGDVGVA